jgi:hypothetical protein
MRRPLTAFGFALLLVSELYAETPPTLSFPPDSPRWELQGEAKPTIVGDKSSCLK